MLSRYGEPGELLALPQRNSARRAVIRALAQSYRVLRAQEHPQAIGAVLLLALLFEATLLVYAERYKADSNAVLMALARACLRPTKVVISAVRTRLRGLRDKELRREAKTRRGRVTLEALTPKFFELSGDSLASRRLAAVWEHLALRERELAYRAWVLEERRRDIAVDLGTTEEAIRVRLHALKVKIREKFEGNPNAPLENSPSKGKPKAR